MLLTSASPTQPRLWKTFFWGWACQMVGAYVRCNCPSLIKSGCDAWWWNWCGGRRMVSTLWQGQSCKAFSVGLPDIKVSPLSWILGHTCGFIWNGLILVLLFNVHSFAWNILYLLIHVQHYKEKRVVLEKPLPKNAHAWISETFSMPMLLTRTECMSELPKEKMHL